MKCVVEFSLATLNLITLTFEVISEQARCYTVRLFEVISEGMRCNTVRLFEVMSEGANCYTVRLKQALPLKTSLIANVLQAFISSSGTLLLPKNPKQMIHVF